MKAIDLIFTDDLEIGSDIEIGYSDDQHVEHILRANPGQFYQYPDVGYGIAKKLNGSIDIQTEKKLIKQALENDTYLIPIDGIKIDPSIGKFQIENYTRKS